SGKLSRTPPLPAPLVMLIRRASDIAPSEITPEALYHDRRRFIALAAGAGAAVAVGVLGSRMRRGEEMARALTSVGRDEDGQREEPTSYEDITTYNNFYEFGTGKDDPSKHAGSLRPRPWT